MMLNGMVCLKTDVYSFKSLLKYSIKKLQSGTMLPVRLISVRLQSQPVMKYLMSKIAILFQGILNASKI